MQPTQFGKNQFGEAQNLSILGGSNQIDINFIVDQTNANGLGNRTLKGSPLVSNVYMNTLETPASGNPNPAAGFAIIEFSAAFQGYITGFSGFVSPASGSAINVTAGLTEGQPYIITQVGTTTLAQWTTLGWTGPALPTVGAAFVAITSADGVGTGQVMVPSVSGISSVEVVGDPNQTCNPATGGGYMIVQFLAPTQATVDSVAGVFKSPMVATQPAYDTVVGMRFVMDSQVGAPIN